MASSDIVKIKRALISVSDKTGIVVLIDNAMLLDRDDWGRWITGLWQQCDGPERSCRLFPNYPLNPR